MIVGVRVGLMTNDVDVGEGDVSDGWWVDVPVGVLVTVTVWVGVVVAVGVTVSVGGSGVGVSVRITNSIDLNKSGGLSSGSPGDI